MNMHNIINLSTTIHRKNTIEHNTKCLQKWLKNRKNKTEFKMFFKSTFSVSAWKDTFKYNVTDGGRISFTEWKNSFSFAAMKDTIRYNIKNNSFKGAFAKDIPWKVQKDCLSTSANGINSIIENAQKIESMVEGKYSISEDIKGMLQKKIAGSSDSTKIIDKTRKIINKAQDNYKNTYTYKSANATN